MKRLVWMLTATAALAPPAMADDCERVRARIKTAVVSTDCSSAVSLCTEGRVTRDSLIAGTTEYVAGGLGGGAVGETSIVTPAVTESTDWAYAGTLTITTDDGTLTLEDVGVYDAANGPYTEYMHIVDGTGVFEGAFGTLFSYGWARSDVQGFRGRIRGKICWEDVVDEDTTDNQCDDDT